MHYERAAAAQADRLGYSLVGTVTENLHSWVVLPVLLLPAGLDYVRSVESPRRRWRGAWMGAAGAGIVLEVLMVPLAYPFVDATPDWGAFAESLGFVAVGTAMIFVLFGAARSESAGPLQPGSLPGPAVP